MIKENDYNLQIFNGDLGILLPDAADPDKLGAHFEKGHKSFRVIAPFRLPGLSFPG